MATTVHKGKTHIFSARDGSENPIITLKAGQGETLNIEGLSAGGGSLVAYGDIDTVSIDTAVSVPFTQSLRDLSLKGACAFGNEYFTCRKSSMGFVYYVDGVYTDFYITDNSTTAAITNMSIYDSIAITSDSDDIGIIEKSGGSWANPTYNPSSSGLNCLQGGGIIDCIQGYVVAQPFNTPGTMNIYIKGSTIADTWDVAPTVQVVLGATITGNQINSTAIYVCYGADKISIRDHDTGAETTSISLVGANLLAVNDTYILCTVGSVVYAYLVSDNSLINAIDTSDTIVDLSINKSFTGTTAIYTTSTEQFILFYSASSGTWKKASLGTNISNASNSVAITDTKIMVVDPLTVQTATNSKGTVYFSAYETLQETGATIGYVKAIDGTGIEIKNDGILALGPINTFPLPAISSSNAQMTCFSAGFEESVIDTLTSTTTSITNLSATSATIATSFNTNLRSTTATITTGNITTINSTTINNAQTITANNAVCTTSLTTPVINGISNVLTVPDIIKITDTTESTSTSTGALQVSGGIAITKDIYINGLVTAPNSPYFVAKKTSPQNNVPSNDVATVTWQTISSNGVFSGNQYTIPETGVYVIGTTLYLYNTDSSWSAMGFINFVIYKNSAYYRLLISVDPGSLDTNADFLTLSAHTVDIFTAGDTVRLHFHPFGSSGVDILTDYTVFSGAMISKLSN